MRLRLVLPFVLSLGIVAQIPPHPRADDPTTTNERLPNGKLQRDEILKAEHQKSLDEARELSKLADELKLDLEKNDANVLPLATLKKVEEIDRLARRIRDRMKH